MADAFIVRRGGGGSGGGGFPQYTYTGESELIDDGNKNWRIKFLTSGTLTFVKLNGAKNGIDVFMVGGGGGGGSGSPYLYSSGFGGGGGYTTTKNFYPAENVAYPIVVGAGGASVAAYTSGNDGGNTTAFDYTCSGGKKGVYDGNSSGRAGDGGSGGGHTAGTDGGDGSGAYSAKGQRSTPGPNGETGTTREFGESTGTLYSNGGKTNGDAADKAANTGNGGDGTTSKGGAGGSGIVIIRNKR